MYYPMHASDSAKTSFRLLNLFTQLQRLANPQDISKKAKLRDECRIKFWNTIHCCLSVIQNRCPLLRLWRCDATFRGRMWRGPGYATRSCASSTCRISAPRRIECVLPTSGKSEIVPSTAITFHNSLRCSACGTRETVSLSPRTRGSGTFINSGQVLDPC